MSDSGDFAGAEPVTISLIGGSQVDNESVTAAIAEIPADKKVARVRIHEKDFAIPGEFSIHGVEFIDEDGVVIAQVKAKVNPRAGCTRDIIIRNDE